MVELAANDTGLDPNPGVIDGTNLLKVTGEVEDDPTPQGIPRQPRARSTGKNRNSLLHSVSEYSGEVVLVAGGNDRNRRDLVEASVRGIQRDCQRITADFTSDLGGEILENPLAALVD